MNGRLAAACAVGVVVGWCARWALEPSATISDPPRPVAPIEPPRPADIAAAGASSRADDDAKPTDPTRAKRPRRAASSEPDAPTPGAGGQPHSPESMALLADIEAAAEDPDDDGAAIYEMARLYTQLQRKPNVPASVVRRLMARGGKFKDAGVLLFGCMAYDEAVREYRGLLSGAPSAAAWGDAARQAEIAVGFFERLGNFVEQLTNDDVLATLAARDPRLRRRGVQFAADRRLLGWESCLERAKTDADSDVRAQALTAALDATADDAAARNVIADEIVAFLRSSDATLRASGLSHLEHAGAKGAAVARELMDAGGLDDDEYLGAARCLIAARRFEGLVSDALEETSRVRLLEALWEALEGDPSIRAQALATARALGVPKTSDEALALCSLADVAGAPELVVEVARSKTAGAGVRGDAISHLLQADETKADGVRAAGEAVADSTSASQRRALVYGIANDLAAAGDEGVALLRRIANNDANPQIRDLAARMLRDAGK
jgi:hypothetical protein